MDNILKLKGSGNSLSKVTDFSLLIFLCVKTGIGNKSILEYITYVAFIGLVFFQVCQTKKVKITKYTIWYTIFVAFCGFSYFWAMSHEFFKQSFFTIGALLIFNIALCNYVDSKEKLNKVIKYFVFANIFTAIKILLLYNIYSGIAAERITEITGIYFNTIAQVMAFSSILTVYIFKICRKKIYLVFLLVQFCAILLTESRKGFLIPIAGIMLMLFLEKKTIKTFITYIIVGIIAIVGIFVFLRTNDAFYQEMQDLYNSMVEKDTQDYSINLREFFIDTGMQIFEDNPILGIGLNNFAYYVKNYTEYTEARYSHNNYIEMLSCLGIVGLILYYWLYIYILVKLFKKVMKNRSNLEVILGFTLVFVLMIFEWGIVSYSGCMYNIIIFIAYYILEFKEKSKNNNKTFEARKELIENGE